MAATMNLTDEVRINILDALLKKNSVLPNIRQLKRYTGYHKATIKSSLEFMQNSGLLTGFGPKVNLRKLGYNLEAISIFQVDLSKKDVFDKYLQQCNDDSHVYRVSSIVGPNNWNLVSRQLYKDIESYYKWVRQTYFEAIPALQDFIKDRQIFYEIEPYYKTASRTESIIKLIRRDKGFE